MTPYGKAVEDSDPTVQEQRNLDKLQTCNHSKEWLTNRETGTWLNAPERTSSTAVHTSANLYTLVSLIPDSELVLARW